MYVRAKKHLGQHFLIDNNIAQKIVSSLQAENVRTVLEIGPGKGILTEILLKRSDIDFYAVEIDTEAANYISTLFPEINEKLFRGDFLKFDFEKLVNQPIAIIGNLPYNISSQIFFKILEHKNQVVEVVCMLQKEVAERMASKHGNKTYGILSVLLQAYYDIEYLFTVNETVFSPPPHVKSAVIRFTRNKTKKLDCDEDLFKKVVKLGFNQRRKTLRNAMKQMLPVDATDIPFLTQRAEQLTVQDFVELTKKISSSKMSETSQIFNIDLEVDILDD